MKAVTGGSTPDCGFSAEFFAFLSSIGRDPDKLGFF
jgi:hypothetical protein